ncbi:MAG: TolC family protein [Saprospirales bacterium]|nr:MAG: TolC family protein [Saprospirales bacterium]
MNDFFTLSKISKSIGMKKILYSAFCLLLLFGYSELKAQDTLHLDMFGLISLARSESPDLMLAEIRYSNRYWQYQAFLADRRPQIEFRGTLPALNRAIEPIVLPDGSEDFRSRSLMNNNANISLSQVVPGTGGTVFLSTGLRRIDLFSGAGIQGGTSWLSTPVSIGISQPLFRYNHIKWEGEIQPLRLAEAEKEFSEELEEISFRAVRYFFDVISAQLNLEAATRDAANADTLYQLSLGRFELGRIAETDLLQMELTLRNAEAQIRQSSIDLDIAMEQLRDFLGIQTEVFFKFELPEDIPDMTVDPDIALEQARNNRSRIISFQRRLLESKSEVERAKGGTGLDIQITGSVGFSQTADNLTGAYRNLIDQEQLSIGIVFPIADWGKTRSRREIARSQLELEQMRISREKVNFERDILIKVQQYQQILQQLELSRKALEITDKGLEITRNRYLIGKIGTLELNESLRQRENARISYINSLRSYWQIYYDLRGLTLYDFEVNQSLVQNPDLNTR